MTQKIDDFKLLLGLVNFERFYMTNAIDRRTSFQYLCDTGAHLVPCSNFNECIMTARQNQGCAVYELSRYSLNSDCYNYLCDLFIDESLQETVRNDRNRMFGSKGGDENGLS